MHSCGALAAWRDERVPRSSRSSCGRACRRSRSCAGRGRRPRPRRGVRAVLHRQVAQLSEPAASRSGIVALRSDDRAERCGYSPRRESRRRRPSSCAARGRASLRLPRVVDGRRDRGSSSMALEVLNLASNDYLVARRRPPARARGRGRARGIGRGRGRVAADRRQSPPARRARGGDRATGCASTACACSTAATRRTSAC